MDYTHCKTIKIQMQHNNEDVTELIDEKTKTEFYKIVERKFKEKYGDTPPNNILNRYTEELEIIKIKKYEEFYLTVYKAMLEYIENNKYILVNGDMSSSFIAYILGIGSVNPIEYNIPYETFLGVNKRIALEVELQTEFIMLEDLKKSTGVTYSDINIKNEDTIKQTIEDKIKLLHINTPYSEAPYCEMAELIKPKNFEDLIKVEGIHKSRWDFCIDKEVLETFNTLGTLITTYDDIYLYLIKKNVNKSIAYKTMNYIRNYKMHTINSFLEWNNYMDYLILNNIPVSFINTCQKIMYLTTKAEICNYVSLQLILTWYKTNYPREYELALNEIKIYVK